MIRDLGDILALMIPMLELPILQRIAAVWPNPQFVIEASQAMCHRDRHVGYDLGWLRILVDRIKQVSDKPPYILTCRFPLWMNPTAGSKKYPMGQYPFCAQLPEDDSEAMAEILAYDLALVKNFPEVTTYVLDMEFNLEGWWTDTPEEFARIIISRIRNVFEPNQKKTIAPGIALMEHDSKEDRTRDYWRRFMTLAGEMIDYPSVHSYGKTGADCIQNLYRFATAVGFDLRKHNLIISETGQPKTEGEDKQLALYQNFFGIVDWTEYPKEIDDTLPGFKQIFLYAATVANAGLFQPDGAPTKAMSWISENFLKGESQ